MVLVNNIFLLNSLNLKRIAKDIDKDSKTEINRAKTQNMHKIDKNK